MKVSITNLLYSCNARFKKDKEVSDSTAPISAPAILKIVGYFSLSQPYKHILWLLLLGLFGANCPHESVEIFLKEHNSLKLNHNLKL